MKNDIQQLIEQVIIKGSLVTDYPIANVTFLSLDALFNDPNSRKLISKAVTSAIDTSTFDGVAAIASRGYLFSGIIANTFDGVGEFFIQKVKSKGDTRFVQIGTSTEYSSDALQVMKGTIQKGKRYLLTDDLIATGGSVLTSIDLIRQCGGIVDTVFVMTELLDLGAQQKLEEAGVQLVSLLKLTETDLTTMLHLQTCYHQNPEAPLTYELSHHTKGAKILTKSNDSPEMHIHVASQSKVKMDATLSAAHGLFSPLQITIEAHDAPSGVNPQPFGLQETRQGAANRLKSLEDSLTESNNDVLVVMENGIRYSAEEDCYYDFVHVMVKRNGILFEQTHDCCIVPKDIILAMNDDFQTTWGLLAKQQGLAKEAQDPHQEAIFGGVSRSTHLLHPLCRAMGGLKNNMLASNLPLMDDLSFSLNRLVEFNNRQSTKKYSKRGIFFQPAERPIHTKPIDLYNQGYKMQDWSLNPDDTARNKFTVFSTGDAFSIVSKDTNIDGANINIHVGLEHEALSPLVLIQEALQLCRCAYEHGARSITVALPEQCHPVLHHNDFNILLMKLFKASGANKIYYYDAQYNGKLDASNIGDQIPLTISNHSDEGAYTIDRRALSEYLQIVDSPDENPPIDEQVSGLMRQDIFKRMWAKIDPKQPDIMDALMAQNPPSKIELPAIKNKPHMILSCSANKPFAENMAKELREKGELVVLHHIEGQGANATIPNDALICGATVTIVQSTRPNPDNLNESMVYQTNGASSYFFEAAMIARQAHLRGADTINLINPYQFSARSDKAEDNIKGKTGAYVQHNANLLQAAGVNHVVTAECHDNHTMSGSYTGKKIRGSAVGALSIIATRLARQWMNDPEHPMKGQLRLVTPDAGAAKRTQALTQQLQAILGEQLCATRILGEKERASHQDSSAVISNMNSGQVGVNGQDKYLITDDETATGSTLCQAVANLKSQGAEDISVIVVHNNMPLDWLMRQLCLARFLFIGVNDIHFSDTHEMGTLATSFDNLIDTYAAMTQLPHEAVKQQVAEWFDKNFKEASAGDYDGFKALFNHLNSRVHVHSLVDAFAKKVVSTPAVCQGQLGTNLSQSGNSFFADSDLISKDTSTLENACP